MSTLRSIAVYVEEREPGRFAWVLIEREADHWRELHQAESPDASYQTSMAEGLLALQHLVHDLDLGPRTDDGPARARPAAAPRGTPARPASSGADPETAPSAKRYFGFGPAR